MAIEIILSVISLIFCEMFQTKTVKKIKVINNQINKTHRLSTSIN